MLARPHPQNAARLESLRSYAVLDSPRRQAFNEIAELVAVLCEVPMAAISLVDEDRQWFLAETGVGVRSTPIEVSVCAHTILDAAFLEVPDLTDDARFSDNPLVTGDMRLRFYAGAPLLSPEGLPLGTLCALDCVPRTLTDEQRQVLKTLSRRVMAEIEVHRQARQVADLADRLRATQTDRQRILSGISRDLRKSVNTVGLSAKMMTRGAVDAGPDSAFVRRLRRATQQMQTLVDRLMPAPACRPGAWEVMAVDTLVAQAVDASQDAAEAAEVSLTRVGAGDAGDVSWDPNRMRGALQAAIAVVLGCTPSGASVGVLVDAVADDIVISVVGTGGGLSADELARQLERATEASAAGGLLGLARDRVEAQGGIMTAASVVGRGSEVRFRVPRGATAGGSDARA